MRLSDYNFDSRYANKKFLLFPFTYVFINNNIYSSFMDLCILQNFHCNFILYCINIVYCEIDDASILYDTILYLDVSDCCFVTSLNFFFRFFLT